MSKKNYVYEKQIKKVKRIKPANTALLCGFALLTSLGIVNGSFMRKANLKINEIQTDFVNNNQSYHEYILERDQKLEDKYTTGDITFDQYLKQKNENSKNDDIESAIDIMAEAEQRQEYKEAMKDRNEAAIPTVLGFAGAFTTASVAVYNILSSGLTEERTKFVTKKKQEEEMER